MEQSGYIRAMVPLLVRILNNFVIYTSNSTLNTKSKQRRKEFSPVIARNITPKFQIASASHETDVIRASVTSDGREEAEVM